MAMAYLDMVWRAAIYYLVIQIGAGANPRIELEVGHGTNAIKDNVILNCTFTTSSATKIRAKWSKNEMGSANTTTVVGLVGEDKKEDRQTEWSYDGRVITSRYNFSRKGVLSSSEAGIYTCEFVDTSNRSLDTTTFDVFTSPFVLGYVPLKEGDYSNVRRSQSVIMDETRKEDLECSAKGYPKPAITWYLINDTEDQNELVGAFAKASPLVTDPNYVLVNGSTIHLKNARFKDRGYYACKAVNSRHPPLVIFTLVRVKSRLAPIWPLVVLISEVVILALILGLCEWHRRKTSKDEEGEGGAKAATSNVQNANSGAITGGGGGSQVRQRQAATGGGKR